MLFRSFRAVVQSLADRNEIVAEKDLLRLATHRIALTAEEQAAKDHLASLFAGKIREGIQERLGGLLTAQPA